MSAFVFTVRTKLSNIQKGYLKSALHTIVFIFKKHCLYTKSGNQYVLKNPHTIYHWIWRKWMKKRNFFFAFIVLDIVIITIIISSSPSPSPSYNIRFCYNGVQTELLEHRDMQAHVRAKFSWICAKSELLNAELAKLADVLYFWPHLT